MLGLDADLESARSSKMDGSEHRGQSEALRATSVKPRFEATSCHHLGHRPTNTVRSAMILLFILHWFGISVALVRDIPLARHPCVEGGASPPGVCLPTVNPGLAVPSTCQMLLRRLLPLPRSCETLMRLCPSTARPTPVSSQECPSDSTLPPAA
jgi:hypothetical protein